MALEIDPDAVLWSAGAAERDDRPLLIVMHGRGSTEEDLFALASDLPSEFVIASLRAPIAEFGGWSWFEPGAGAPGDPLVEDADLAAAAVTTWLDALPFSPSLVGTLGFSQGGAMSTHVLRRDLDRIAFAVNLAGFIVSGAQPSDTALEISQPPVFWGRGADDELFTDDVVERTQPWLERHATLVQRVYPGLGHSISATELADVTEFLAERISS